MFLTDFISAMSACDTSMSMATSSSSPHLSTSIASSMSPAHHQQQVMINTTSVKPHPTCTDTHTHTHTTHTHTHTHTFGIPGHGCIRRGALVCGLKKQPSPLYIHTAHTHTHTHTLVALYIIPAQVSEVVQVYCWSSCHQRQAFLSSGPRQSLAYSKHSEVALQR